MFTLRLFALLLAGLTACTTGPKKNLDQIEAAITQGPNQGPESLKAACQQGSTGACALSGEKVEAKHPLPILQSVTSNSQARFVLSVPKGEHPRYYIKRGTLISSLTAERFERATSSVAVDQVEAFDLKINETYELFVLGQDSSLWDQRTFKALDLSHVRSRVAVISCMDDHLKVPMLKMWPQVLSQKPDAIWMIGDNVYADHLEKGWGDTNPESLWNRYVQTRAELPIYKARQLIPVFATWDDHDFGRNDSDRTYAYKEQSTDIFFAFFAQKKPAPGFERGPGVASWLSTFGVQVGLLDDRSFRSPDNTNLPDETHLGLEQMGWIQKHLQTAKAPVLLVDGDQFFGGYHKFESFQGSHPKDFLKALNEWKKSKVPVLFISGDRHLSEIIKVERSALGYPTFEITSSGIHSTVFADAFVRAPSPNQLIGVAGQYNYSVLEFMRASKTLLQVSVQAFGIDEKLLYQKTLTVKHP